jgi:hypothetical protein
MIRSSKAQTRNLQVEIEKHVRHANRVRPPKQRFRSRFESFRHAPFQTEHLAPKSDSQFLEFSFASISLSLKSRLDRSVNNTQLTKVKVVGTFHVPSTWNPGKSLTANGTAERGLHLLSAVSIKASN